MYTIIFATGNAGKMKEIRNIMADMQVELLSMKEAHLSPEIDENGTTFAENAMIKASGVARALRTAFEQQKREGISSDGFTLPDPDCTIVLADDSGLEIDYLNKEPGIYSARYLGEDTSYHIKNANLIERLTGVPDRDRTARFVCAIAAVLPDGSTLSEHGTIEGIIGYEERGENGFGYDPIFLLPEIDKTTAELKADEKDAVSHRGKALRAMKQALAERLGI